MSTRAVKLIDPGCTVVAIAQVVGRDQRYRGKIDLELMPTNVRKTFADFEEIVNGQMFSLLDEVEEQIREMQLKIRFDSGDEFATEDLQVYPSTNRISFQLVEESNTSRTIPNTPYAQITARTRSTIS